MRIDRKLRRAVFEIYETYRELRESRGIKYDWDDLATAVCTALDADNSLRRYRHVVIDEGQDFSPEMIRSLAKAIPPDGSLTFFGDVAQQIYGHRMSWRSAGLSVMKVWEFKENYRNTKQIARLGLAISRMPYFKGVPDIVEPVSPTADGPLPTLVECPSIDREIQFIIAQANRAAKTLSVAILPRRREATRRGRTRLCHFTPSRNLVHIASGETGILATKKLYDTERSVFTPTDLERLDGHEGYISCSIEYPNVWYFDKARAKDVLFKDWVVLLINPQYLWLPGTRFCPRNAASNYGSGVSEGEAAFLALFANSVVGAYGKIFTRSPDRLPCCPTDEQAEVLIPDQIVLADTLAIAVVTETQAKNEAVRLRLVDVPDNRFKFVVAPDLFKKYPLSKLIQSGKRPIETPCPKRDEV